MVTFLRVLLVPLLLGLIVVPALHLATPLGGSGSHPGRAGLVPNDASAALPRVLPDGGPIGQGEPQAALPLLVDRPFVPPRV